MARTRSSPADPLRWGRKAVLYGFLAVAAMAAVPVLDAAAGDSLGDWIAAEQTISAVGEQTEVVDEWPIPWAAPSSTTSSAGETSVADTAPTSAKSLVDDTNTSSSSAADSTLETTATPSVDASPATTETASRSTSATFSTPTTSSNHTASSSPTTKAVATSAPSTTASTSSSTTTTHHSHPSTTVASSGALAALRNDNPLFSRFASVPSDQLSLSALTEPANRPDNGSNGDGQFRVACQYSHFAYDDPIVFPGQPGRSHLHMFFGNTSANANTTAAELLNHGGGTCNGFELNRSAYWVPALLDGKGHVVVPEKIILYYKTKFPDQVQALPQGLKMISGSTSGSFTTSNHLHWSCGKNGHAYNKTNRIPDCGGDVINASIVFPECWDGVNLDSPNHRSHLLMVGAKEPCPASHPVRLPQISILLYFPGQSSIDGWHLSADGHGHEQGDGPPGGSLHADWFGGWNEEAVRLWTESCLASARNCSLGQTGTDRQFARLNDRQNYPGPYLLPLDGGR